MSYPYAMSVEQHNSPLESTSQLDSREYGFTFKPFPHHVRIEALGTIVADSRQVMVMNETRLPPVYYIPQCDVRMDLMRTTQHHTICPFKGNANYWTLEIGSERIENIMWCYEDPLPEAIQIKDYVAFYANLVQHIFIDGQSVRNSLATAEESTYSNPLLYWLMHDAPHQSSAKNLTEAFARQMLVAGIPIWRLAVIIPTLHPQVNALAYRWWRKNDTTEEIQVSHQVLVNPEYLNSPFVPIFEGAGGIRRRLDIKDPVLDYGILQDLLSEGATDYVAIPMTFTDGQINVVTLTADRPGGFSTNELGYIYEISALLGRLYEVHAMRFRAVSLLDTYLGRLAGKRVLDGLIKRGDGESIEAIIWFCDLRESTALTRSMPRDDYLSLLDNFFDAMAGAVIDNGGQVLSYIGDAVMAIFPIDVSDSGALASVMTPDEARIKALAAADDAAQRISSINEERDSAKQALIRYGLALHPGTVTYGNIGTESRLQFTVIGDAANTATRIETLCKVLGRQMLVSKGFAMHFPQRFESLGMHNLRGVSEPQEIFSLRAHTKDFGESSLDSPAEPT